MDFIKIESRQSNGLEFKTLRIEALRSRGLSQLTITGLPDAWLRESRDKIKALVSSLVEWGPLDRVLVHLLPADQSKNGAHLELPIALACLTVLARRPFPPATLEFLESHHFISALSLDGTLESTADGEILEVASEDRVVGARNFRSLGDVWAYAWQPARELPQLPERSRRRSAPPDLRVELRGRYWERYLLTCAAIAELPVLMLGPPGSGKSFLARWAQRLLPVPEPALSREISQIWALAGLERPESLPLVTPHSRTLLSEFVGSSAKGLPRPGFFSLAHGGLLVLDEFAEMNRDCREILRTILDERRVVRAAAGQLVRWPARFWLIATSNPCPCGYARGDRLAECRCPRGALVSYQSRFSGPFMDRMGLKLHIDREESSSTPEFCGVSDERLNEKDEPLNLYVTRMRDESRAFLKKSEERVFGEANLARLSAREKQNKVRLLAAMLAQAPAREEECVVTLMGLLATEKTLLGAKRDPIF